MKNFLLLPFTFCLTLHAAAQPDIEWSRALGGSKDDFARDIEFTGDGGYLLLGSTLSNNNGINNHGWYDFWLVKIDATGNLQWQKTLGGSNWDLGFSINATADGGYILGGQVASSDGDVTEWKGDFDCWAVKINATGEILWQKTLGGSGEDLITSIHQTTDGGYFIAGYTYSNDGDVVGLHDLPFTTRDAWVVKLNSSGDIEWQKALGGTDNDAARYGQQTSDGGYIVVGETASHNTGDVSGHHAERDSWVIKLDVSGAIEWQHPFGGDRDDALNHIQQTADGGYIAIGYTTSIVGDMALKYYSGFSGDIAVIKITANGSMEWSKSYGTNGSDGGTCIRQTPDGGYVFISNVGSNDQDVFGSHGDIDMWLVKINSLGDIEWKKTLGGSNTENALFLHRTPDDGYIVTGSSSSNDGDVFGNHGDQDAWIVKLSATVGTQTPTQSTLEIYPNPAHNALFFPAEYTGATALVTDVLGRICLHQIISQDNKLNIAQLPQGFYALSVRMPAGEWLSGKFCKE